MDNLKQKSRRGEVITQHYCMVKTARAGLGYARLSSGVNGRDK